MDFPRVTRNLRRYVFWLILLVVIYFFLLIYKHNEIFKRRDRCPDFKGAALPFTNGRHTFYSRCIKRYRDVICSERQQKKHLAELELPRSSYSLLHNTLNIYKLKKLILLGLLQGLLGMHRALWNFILYYFILNLCHQGGARRRRNEAPVKLSNGNTATWYQIGAQFISEALDTQRKICDKIQLGGAARTSVNNRHIKVGRSLPRRLGAGGCACVKLSNIFQYNKLGPTPKHVW